MSSAEEFDQLYERSRDRLARQLFALTGDAHGADDLVQEAFVRTWLKWDRVSGYDNPEAFVRRVAYNLAKKQWRRRRLSLGAPLPEQQHHDKDPFARPSLVAALRTLPVKERQAVVLHYVGGLPIDDIAAQMGAPSGTVKSWLSRGRSRLASRLGQTDPEATTRHG